MQVTHQARQAVLLSFYIHYLRFCMPILQLWKAANLQSGIWYKQSLESYIWSPFAGFHLGMVNGMKVQKDMAKSERCEATSGAPRFLRTSLPLCVKYFSLKYNISVIDASLGRIQYMCHKSTSVLLALLSHFISQCSKIISVLRDRILTFWIPSRFFCSAVFSSVSWSKDTIVVCVCACVKQGGIKTVLPSSEWEYINYSCAPAKRHSCLFITSFI